MKSWIVRGLMYIVFFAVLSGISGYISFRVVSKEVTVEVPALEGLARDAAQRSLEHMGLVMQVAQERFDISVPEGMVISQDVPRGTLLKGGGIVGVIVSKGPEYFKVPSVLGIRVDEAKEMLKKNSLELERVIEVHTEGVPAGNVVAQSPEGGERSGEKVTIVASLGPYKVSYYCPLFKGMMVEDAVVLANELGLVVDLYEYQGTRLITQQSPAPDTVIRLGDTIRLTVGDKR